MSLCYDLCFRRGNVGIRETINQKPGVALAIAGFIICASAAVCLSLLVRGRSSGSAVVPLAFYSDDDGKTWFIDAATRIAPFEHNGRQAVRAEVFRCGDGAAFVGFLERSSDASRARIAHLDTQNPNAIWMAVSADPMDVKRPGAERWVSLFPPAGSTAEYHGVITPTCPQGNSGDISHVFPSDVNNGAAPAAVSGQ
jgi:hypothetical protein